MNEQSSITVGQVGEGRSEDSHQGAAGGVVAKVGGGEVEKVAKKPHNRTHGWSRKRVYKCWTAMKQRCSNPKCKAFPDYGGRGITVCDDWRKFDKFYEDMGDRPKGMSLDRINNDLGYSKSNCRWTTHRQQMNNTRRTVRINGEPISLAAESVGMNRNTYYARVHLGHSLTEPIGSLRRGQRNYQAELTNQQAKEIRRLAELDTTNGRGRRLADKFGVSESIISKVLKRVTYTSDDI